MQGEKVLAKERSRKAGSCHRALLLLFLVSAPSVAQELEPRAYSPSPVGTTFVVVAYARSSGDVTFDPTVPITDVRATLNSVALGVGQTFGLFGRQALLTVAVPYVWGTASGQVREARASVSRSGGADLRLRFSMNIRGSPALTPKEFAASRRRAMLLGASLSVSAPTGQYDPTKLINLGTNRWAFKPEVGMSYPLKSFDLDLYGGAWLFTENSNFFPGTSVRTQRVLPALQTHVSYSFCRSFWLAADATWYGGGAVRVDDGPPTSPISNSRLGATLSIPVTRQQSVKVAYSSGVTARTGSSFRTLSVAWQFVWFDLWGPSRSSHNPESKTTRR